MNETRRRWLINSLFAAVALLHLLPVWRVDYVPTVDGASHVYNASALRELSFGTPEFQRVYSADLRPYPNWLGHAFLFVAMTIAPPVIAEKLLVSINILLFLGGCWRLAGVVDPRSKVYALLAMPLAFHALMQMGFYNYAIGAALALFAIAGKVAAGADGSRSLRRRSGCCSATSPTRSRCCSRSSSGSSRLQYAAGKQSGEEVWNFSRRSFSCSGLFFNQKLPAGTGPGPER